MAVIPPWEALIASAASKLNITEAAKNLLSANGTASVLETTIKQMPKKEFCDALKGRSLSVSKKKFGVIPTTKISVKFDD